MAYWKNSKVTDIGAIGKDWVAKTAYRVFKTLQSKNKFYELDGSIGCSLSLTVYKD